MQRSSKPHCGNHRIQRHIGADTSMTAQSRFVFARHFASCNDRRPKCHGQKNHMNVKLRFRCSHWIGNLASRKLGRSHCSSRSRRFTALVEWNVEMSKDVLQQYDHWMELISKYEAVSGDEITDAVKII